MLGIPNTGKTTILNALCGTKQKIANYPGTTVEKKVGNCELGKIIDLPGLYSLQSQAPDELLSRQSLLGQIGPSPDLIVFVLDATNLRRNLFLYSQILN